MPNTLAQSLKAEIQRISRKEIRSSITPIHSSTVALKKTIADLKKRLATLESSNKRLQLLQKSIQPTPQVTSEEMQKVRITAKSIKALRNKLGLSQEQFAKLIDVSSQNVFIMEHKAGRLKMRSGTLLKLLAIKGIGKKAAKKRLKGI